MIKKTNISEITILSDLLLGSKKRRKNLAKLLLKECFCITQISKLDIFELQELGLGHYEAKRLKSVFILAQEYLNQTPKMNKITNSIDAYNIIYPYLSKQDRERFVVLLMDIRNKPKRILTITEGSVDRCPVDPREIFTPALKTRASAIIVAHNHPSGDSSPSEDDFLLTQRLVDCGEIVGIPLLDHIIVGDHRNYTSFSTHGWLKNTLKNHKKYTNCSAG